MSSNPINELFADRSLPPMSQALADTRLIEVRPHEDVTGSNLSYSFAGTDRSIIDMNKSYFRVSGNWYQRGTTAPVPPPIQNGLNSFSPEPVAAQFSEIHITANGVPLNESNQGVSRSLAHFARTSIEENQDYGKGQFTRNVETEFTLEPDGTTTNDTVHQSLSVIGESFINPLVSQVGDGALKEGYTNDGNYYVSEDARLPDNTTTYSTFFGNTVASDNHAYHKGRKLQTFMASSQQGRRVYNHRPADSGFRLVIPPRVRLEFNVIKSSDQYHAIGDTQAKDNFDPVFIPSDITLFLHQFTPSLPSLDQLRQQLQMAPSFQQVMKVEARRISTSATNSVNISSFYSGKKPAFVGVMFVDSAATSKGSSSADFRLSPYSTIDTRTSSVGVSSSTDGWVKNIRIEGDKVYPSESKRALSSTDDIHYQEGYIKLAHATLRRDAPFLCQNMFLSGSRIYFIDLEEQSVPPGDMLSDPNRPVVSLNLSADFGGSDYANYLASSPPRIDVVTFSFVNQIVEIDADGNVSTM